VLTCSEAAQRVFARASLLPPLNCVSADPLKNQGCSNLNWLHLSRFGEILQIRRIIGCLAESTHGIGSDLVTAEYPRPTRMHEFAGPRAGDAMRIVPPNPEIGEEINKSRRETNNNLSP
jgi:hypothetical protein